MFEIIIGMAGLLVGILLLLVTIVSVYGVNKKDEQLHPATPVIIGVMAFLYIANASIILSERMQ